MQVRKNLLIGKVMEGLILNNYSEAILKTKKDIIKFTIFIDDNGDLNIERTYLEGEKVNESITSKYGDEQFAELMASFVWASFASLEENYPSKDYKVEADPKMAIRNYYASIKPLLALTNHELTRVLLLKDEGVIELLQSKFDYECPKEGKISNLLEELDDYYEFAYIRLEEMRKTYYKIFNGETEFTLALADEAWKAYMADDSEPTLPDRGGR